MDAAIKPGGTYLNWLTSVMKEYVDNIRKAVEDLEFVIKRVILIIFYNSLILL